jgi:hypothetical protein
MLLSGKLINRERIVGKRTRNIEMNKLHRAKTI